MTELNIIGLKLFIILIFKYIDTHYIIVKPKSSPKSKSKIQFKILNPKSRGKELGLGLTLLSYRPHTHP